MFLDPIAPSERFRQSIEGPIGWFTVVADDRAVIHTEWGRAPARPSPVTRAAADQLAAYFAGTLRNFDLPLAPRGSAHEITVWTELCRIPFGQTITYGELARRSASVARAVGGTCGANPIAIIIPCHRVTAAGGALGGYSGHGGPDTKRKLLALEARIANSFTLSA